MTIAVQNIRIIALISTVVVLICHLSSAQTEYLVTVNPVTGEFTKIDSLPGVKWITVGPSYTVFDEDNGQFIFQGQDADGNSFLYSVDAPSGEIISQPSFPALEDSEDNVVELQFDNTSNKLYALSWDSSEGKEFFGEVNPATGIFSPIDSLPGVLYISILPNFTTYDNNNHRYFFHGYDASNLGRLYIVDAATADLISNAPFPLLTDPLDNVIELQYDNSSNTLFALHWDNSEGMEFLVSVDPFTGDYTLITELPGVSWISTSPHYTVFDETQHRYVFRGGDDNGNWYLYSVDVNAENIVFSPLFPVLDYPEDNVVELQVDNSTGNYYALHWEVNTITGISSFIDTGTFEIFPNPMQSTTTVSVNQASANTTLFMYDALGNVVHRSNHPHATSIEVPRGTLLPGTYFISLVCDHQHTGIKKLIVE